MQNKFNSKPKINVGQNERVASLLGGGALVLYALSRASRLRLPLVLSGGYLLYRGATGRCYVYQGLEIDRSAEGAQTGIQVDRGLTINRPREEVYRFWRNFENLPRFMHHLEAVDVADGNRSHWVAKAPLGIKAEWDAVITEERPNEMIAWETLPGSEVEHTGRVWFSDAPGDRGTEVKVDLRYRVIGGLAYAGFAKLFGKEPDQQIREDLSRFKQVMEAGETATVLGQPSGRVDEIEEERLQIKRRRGKDEVQEASEESFPASDPPSWAVGG